MGFCSAPGRSRAIRAPACHRAAHPFAPRFHHAKAPGGRPGPLRAVPATFTRPRAGRDARP
jgi:hypothetical protein